jgi:hypothetical protein
MNKIILDFTDIGAGWMYMHIYDYINEEIRKMRISYVQPFFDDLLMACKFLLSDITGIYEVYIDQEGFEANIRLYKYQDETICVEINEDAFEDEVPYDGRDFKPEYSPTLLTYFNVDVREFVENLVLLIDRKKEEYNEGFVFTPSEQLNKELLSQVKQMYYKKYMSGGDNNEEISNP